MPKNGFEIYYQFTKLAFLFDFSEYCLGLMNKQLDGTQKLKENLMAVISTLSKTVFIISESKPEIIWLKISKNIAKRFKSFIFINKSNLKYMILKICVHDKSSKYGFITELKSNKLTKPVYFKFEIKASKKIKITKW